MSVSVNIEHKVIFVQILALFDSFVPYYNGYNALF